MNSDFTPIIVNRPPQGAFITYVLQSCKISCKYIGRLDICSGYFGASQHISTANSGSPDYATTDFTYIDDSLNSVTVEAIEGINVIYYPPDYNYLNFNRINQDLVATGSSSTNFRLNIYGNLLPNTGTTSSIVLTVNCIYNIIPTPLFSDLLPTSQSAKSNNMLELINISNIVPKTNLGVYSNSESYDLERFIHLPKPLKEKALKEYEYMDKSNNEHKNILNLIKTLIGEKNILIDKNILDYIMKKDDNKNEKEQDKRINEDDTEMKIEPFTRSTRDENLQCKINNLPYVVVENKDEEGTKADINIS